MFYMSAERKYGYKEQMTNSGFKMAVCETCVVDSRPK